jgi:hypothetical protein
LRKFDYPDGAYVHMVQMYADNSLASITQSAAAVVLVFVGNRCVCYAMFDYFLLVPQVWQIPNDA